MESILAEVCRRDQFTCQQCGKTMEHVERYLVLHLVRRTREALLPRDCKLQCTHYLNSGQQSVAEVVLEHTGGKYAPRTPVRVRMLGLGKQVLEDSTAYGIDVIDSINAVLAETADEEDRKILERMRRTMAYSDD